MLAVLCVLRGGSSAPSAAVVSAAATSATAAAARRLASCAAAVGAPLASPRRRWSSSASGAVPADLTGGGGGSSSGSSSGSGGSSSSSSSGSGSSAPPPPPLPGTRREAYAAAAAQRIAGIYYDPRVAARLTARERQVWGSLEDEPPTELMADHGLLYGTSGASLEAHLARISAAAGGGEAAAAAAAMVRRALSTRTGNIAAVSSFRKAELLRKFAEKPHDTGSSRVQVAMLTERIQRISAHLGANKKDTFCKRALTALTVRRRKLLEYMTRSDYQGYRVSVAELGLRPVPLVYDRHLPKQRTETHRQINERNRRLKNRVSRGHKGH